MKLRHLLRKQERLILERIVHNRELEIENLNTLSDRELLEKINECLRKDDKIKYVLEKLDPQERRLFDFLALYGGDAKEQEVISHLYPEAPNAYLKSIDVLSAHCLAFRIAGAEPDKAHCYIPEQYLKYILVPRFAVKRLDHLLKQSSLGQLKSIVFDGLNLKPKSAQPDDLIELIKNVLLNPENLKVHLDGMNYSKKVFLRLLVENGGEADVDDIRQLYEQMEGLDARIFDDVFEDFLWREGFLFLEDVGQRNIKRKEHARVVSIPIEVYAYIRSNFKPVDLSPIGLFNFLLMQDIEPEKPAAVTKFDILNDMRLFLGFVANKQPQVLKKGGLRKNFFDNLCHELQRDYEHGYLEYINLFCEIMDMLKERNGCWYVVTENCKIMQSPWELYQSIFRFWLTNPRWHAFYESNSRPSRLLPQMPVEENNPDISYLTSLFSMVPSKQRVNLDQLLGMLFDKASLLPNAVTSSSSMYSAFSNSYDHLVPQDLQHAFLTVFKWLEMVEINEDTLGRVTTHLTETGEAMLELQSIEEDFDESYEFVTKISLDETGKIVAPANIDPVVFIGLCHFARIVEADGDFILQIDTDSLRIGMEGGLSYEDIVDFLKKQSQKAVPNRLKEVIKECYTRHGEIVIGCASGYLKVKNKKLFEEISANTKLAEQLISFDEENLLMFVKSCCDPLKIAKDLSSQGYIPSVAIYAPMVVNKDMVNFDITKEDFQRIIETVQIAIDVCQRAEVPGKAKEFKGLLDKLPTIEDLTPDKLSEAALSKGASEIDLVTEKPESKPAEDSAKPVKEVEQPTNPVVQVAEKKEDIKAMIEGAIKSKTKIKILYNIQNQEADSFEKIISPNYILNSFLHAYCHTTQTDKVFYIDKIKKAEMYSE